MTAVNNEELVKRIARLAKQNQELEQLLKKLEKQNEKLALENEKIKILLGKEPQDFSKEAADKQERSLKFNMATVLYAGLNIKKTAVESFDQVPVLDELDEIFFRFDEITARFKTQKIKTIGDTYMCAGGIPVKNITNPVEVVLAAILMQNVLEEFEKDKRGNEEERIWEFKIGINTGPVTATVTGRKKISYDIKGDTVNNASRLGTLSKNGSVLITELTYELVKELYVCDYFGKLPVKYKGNLGIYSVKGLRPELSVEGKGREPDENFWIKFGLIQFTDIQEIILDKLEKELPGFLYYHNVKHTVDVVTEVELIGWAEGCTDLDILLLKTAALFHDAGHTISYENHEYHGAEMAKKMLPSYGYSTSQIDRICSLIMATKLPPKPSDLLEQIICDSDLDYLGRSDFIPVSNTLFEELKAQNKMNELNEWNKLQVKFISGHQYFTRTARSLREVNKQLQIERIQNLIEG
jgi:adenylate cyclase